MILLQLSAGQGPDECCKAVGLTMQYLQKQCQAAKLKLDVIEMVMGNRSGGFKSVLLQLEGKNASQIATSWQGPMLWICPSPYRPKHRRKNWFFSGQVFEIDENAMDNTITFQTCRSSGAGGQHVNTTDSAVRATHTASGISVRVESERSQHANKRLARALLYQKLESARHEAMTQQEKARWLQHWELERGNPVKTFKGEKFTLS